MAYGGYHYLLCAVDDVIICSCFQINALAKFVDILCIFFYPHSPYCAYRCPEYKLSAFQVKILRENKLNATTQQFITAKNIRLRVETGVKHTHHCVRAIYNCKMRLR